MIVVIGSPRPGARSAGAAGLAAAIAAAAAASGAVVQLVGKVADDPAGDAIILALADAGVGHVALLRSPVGGAIGLEPADVALALDYLTDGRVIVLAEPAAADLVPAAVSASTFIGCHLVAIVPSAGAVPSGLPPDATVLATPRDGGDGDFARVVAAYAVALDRGDPAAAAWTAARSSIGIEAVPAD